MRTPRENWTLARLLAGMDLNGETDAMAEPWRSMAEALAAVPAPDRPAAFQLMLAARPDRDELVMDLANERPDEPPPEDEGDALDEWEPIRLGTLPPVEPFPLDVLPCPARDLATAAAESIGCPIDFAAVAILAAASGLIGRSASLLVKPGYFESASLYLALVGTPSTGKSPALGAAMAPVWSIASMLDQVGRAEMDAWNETDPKARGDKPTLRRIVTTDPTTEALGPILARNPRGLIVAPDEMTKWVMSMDQYKSGKGGDRPFYLSAWKGEPVYIDRAKNMSEPIVVPHPFLTVAGGLTPGMLPELNEGKGRDDGFEARLLFSYPDPKRHRYSDRGIPDSVAKEWERMAESLWNRAMRENDGKTVPHVVKWSPKAAAAWADWCNARIVTSRMPMTSPTRWKGHGESWKPMPPGWRWFFISWTWRATRPAPATARPNRPSCPGESSMTPLALSSTSSPTPAASMPPSMGNSSTEGRTSAPDTLDSPQ